jgi:hypothetical protein
MSDCKPTEETMELAAKALGVEFYESLTWKDGKSVCMKKTFQNLHFCSGFAEWALPILEERHGTLWLKLELDNGQKPDRLHISVYRDAGGWCAEGKFYKNGVGLWQGIESNGPHIDAAVLELAANIQRRIEQTPEA